MKRLTDNFGRRIDYLRLSVTDRCNLRCVYCMPKRMRFLPKRDVLSIEELEALASAFIRRGVRAVRITGGEPLMRGGVMRLFRALSRHLRRGALDEIALTTNGSRLGSFAGALRDCGVERVNVSLDTLKPDIFSALTRGGLLSEVLLGLEAADKAGLRVKINLVVLGDANLDEVPEVIMWAHGRGYAVSLIEVMPLGDVGEDRLAQYVPLDCVRRRLSERWVLESEGYRSLGPSRYVRVRETGGLLGFITPLTENFCASCNRVRVSCVGEFFGCLGRGVSVDLRGALRGGFLDEAIDRALLGKMWGHDFRIGGGVGVPVARHMSVTGG